MKIVVVTMMVDGADAVADDGGGRGDEDRGDDVSRRCGSRST